MLKDQKNSQLKICLWGHAYNDTYLFIIPLLLPFFRQEFSFTYFQSGLILAIHVALRSIFSLIFGLLGDRFNHKHLFISFGFALSSILLGSVVWISFVFFIEGFSATMAPFLYGWLADQFGLVYAYRLASIPFLISFLLYIVLYFMTEKQLPIKINTAPIQ